MDTVSVGIVGDRDPNNLTHRATEESLRHAGAHLGVSVSPEWLPTDVLERRAGEYVPRFDAVFCSPGSPYRSFTGALEAIRFVRESGVPFIGTCGGFQHAVIEYARNVLGLSDAGHAEYDPNASNPFVSALSCSPFGQTMRVEVAEGSRAYVIYGGPRAEEEYRCNYGLEPGTRELLERGGLLVSGVDPDGEVRILELPDHSFYVATLFVPQLGSSPGKPHPLVVALLDAALQAPGKGEKTRQQKVT